MSLAFDVIMEKCPTLKKIIEEKITAEIVPLQQRISELEAQLAAINPPEEGTE